MEDVAIIGGGITGCSIARELCKYDLKITLLEKGDDVASGTSKANSAIVHAGFDAVPGTWKARLNVIGNTLYPKICEELEVPFKLNGSLVVAVDNAEEEALYGLLERGRQNKVPDLRIIGREELMEMEPHLGPDCRAALVAPTGGIVCPYELTIALGENANINGVDFWFEAPVVDIRLEDDGSKTLVTPKGELRAKYVINAAGLYADEISKMAGAEEYTITPRKGDYLVFDKEFGHLANAAIFPTPTKKSKGILVCPTVDGNIFIGPNSNDIEEKDDISVSAAGIEEIVAGGLKLMPDLPMRNVITSFAGNRAVSNTNDFIIEASKLVRGFINVGGIQSPGLTSAPAIAKMVADILREEGQELRERPDYIPTRPPKYRFRDMDNTGRQRLIEEDPAFGHVICRCETITEGEIVDSIRRPIGARSVDAVKRRTRAGMGRCQGGFCSPRVVAILARELGIDPRQVTKAGSDSEVLTGQVKDYLGEEGVKGDQ